MRWEEQVQQLEAKRKKALERLEQARHVSKFGFYDDEEHARKIEAAESELSFISQEICEIRNLHRDVYLISDSNGRFYGVFGDHPGLKEIYPQDRMVKDAVDRALAEYGVPRNDTHPLPNGGVWWANIFERVEINVKKVQMNVWPAIG